MDVIVNQFFPFVRNEASQILVLCFSSWVLSIPFATFGIKKIIDLLKKIY